MHDRTAARIWARIDSSGGPDACWPWLGHRTVDGYGRTEILGKAWRVHRWVLTQVVGTLAPHEVARHTCDNRICCNPAHLLRGSHADNMQDRAERNRQQTGESHWTHRAPHLVHRGVWNPAAELSQDDVLEIRRRHAAGETQTVLAREYHVSQGHVSNIVHRRKWSHLKE